MKLFKTFCVIFAVCIININVITLLGISGAITLFYSSGFGVDSNELVYLGIDTGDILVYQGETLVRSFRAPTSRGYFMTVENDMIRVGMGDYSCLMDLDGTIVYKTADPRSSTYFKLQFNRTCTTIDGKQYKLKQFLGRTRIVNVTNQQEIIIYQMPVEVFVVKILLYITIPFAMLSIIFFIVYFIQKKSKARCSAKNRRKIM